MARCSVPPRDRMFVKGYGLLSFAKNIGKNIGKDISENISKDISENPGSKNSQILLDQAK